MPMMVKLLSNIEPRRKALIIPKILPKMVEKSKAAMDSSNVAGKRLNTI